MTDFFNGLLGNFDLIYTRFLLSHLAKPAEVLSWMVKCLRSGGVLAVEDVDLSGYFCYPPLPAFDRWSHRHLRLVAGASQGRSNFHSRGLMPALVYCFGRCFGGALTSRIHVARTFFASSLSI